MVSSPPPGSKNSLASPPKNLSPKSLPEDAGDVDERVDAAEAVLRREGGDAGLYRVRQVDDHADLRVLIGRLNEIAE